MDATNKRQLQQQEVDANYAAFREQLPELLYGEHAGKHALMKDRKVFGFFDTSNDAWVAGTLLFDDGFFSVQPVSNEIVDLRLWRHAL